jgi:hypothetical protein
MQSGFFCRCGPAWALADLRGYSVTAPRLFISYSWSSQEHELWVVDLAARLVESGIDVILDKWALKEGHDSIAFMEKMVTEPTITKVAVISDRKYAEKADGRVSGVGTETQIISRGVYEKQDQNKFVAVLPERDEEGRPYLPTYYKGRIYIDLSSPENYASEFERLVRWVFDKPLHVKPELGKPPAFLEEEPAKSLGTSLSFRRSMDALKNGRPFVEGAVDEYLTTFAENLEKFRITFDVAADIDAQVVASIEEFTPHKNEFVQVVLAIAQYAPTDDMQKKLHRFFEQLLLYLDRPEHVSSHYSHEFDNFKFIVHELYLYTIAILIRYERFDFANRLLGTPYYLSTNASRGRDAISNFTAFREYMESFQARDRKLGKLSSRAVLLKQRAESSGFDFKWLMLADFVLYLRATLLDDDVRWWPETLVYAVRSYGPMEIFARSQSASYYEQASKMLGGIAADDLKAHIASLQGNDDRLPRWQFDRLSPAVLAGIDKLASVP